MLNRVLKILTKESYITKDGNTQVTHFKDSEGTYHQESVDLTKDIPIRKAYYNEFIEYMDGFGNKIIPFKTNELFEINNNEIILKPFYGAYISIKGRIQSKEREGYSIYFRLCDTEGNELNKNESISIKKLKYSGLCSYIFDYKFNYLQFKQGFEWIEGLVLDSRFYESLVFTFDEHIEIDKDKSEINLKLDLWKLSEKFMNS